jgi:TonB family protein
MKREFIPVALLLMLIAGTAVGRCDELAQIERDLNIEFKDKVLLMRSYTQGEKLDYNALGELVRGGPPGTWTLEGHIEIKKVDLSASRLEIKGSRILVAFDLGKKRWYGMAGDSLTIRVALPQGQVTAEGMHQLFFKVFIPLAQDTGILSPLYWRGVIEGKKPEEILPEDHGTLMGDPIEAVGKKYGIFAPKMLSTPSPSYSVEARTHRVTGTVRFAIIVNKQGEVYDILELSAPLGAGLDQNAIKTVRKWSLKPALKNGVPVVVQMLLEVSFRLA